MRSFILIFVSILCNSVVLAAPAPPSSPDPISPCSPGHPVDSHPSPSQRFLPPPPSPDDHTGDYQHHIAGPSTSHSSSAHVAGPLSTKFSGPVLDGDRIMCPVPGCGVITEMAQGMPKHIEAKHPHDAPRLLELFWSHGRFDTWDTCPDCPYKSKDNMKRHIRDVHVHQSNKISSGRKPKRRGVWKPSPLEDHLHGHQSTPAPAVTGWIPSPYENRLDHKAKSHPPVTKAE